MQNIILSIRDGVIVDNELWFFENDIQAFCKMNIETFEMKIVAPLYSQYLFYSMWIFHWKNRLYAISMNPQWILVFDINTLEIKEMRNVEVSLNSKSWISNTFQQDNILWMIPCYAQNSLWYFDMNSNQFEKDFFFSEYINKLSKGNEMLICRSSLWKQELYCVIYKTPYLVKYDVKLKQITKFSFPEITGTLDSVLYCDGSIWVTIEGKSNIYRIKDGQITEITVDGIQSYSNMQETEHFILVLPRFGDNVVMIDKRTLGVHIVALPEQESKTVQNGASKILNALEREYDIILFPNAVDNLAILSKTTFQIEAVQIKCNDLYQKMKCYRKFTGRNQCTESDAFPLNDYLDYVWANRKDNHDKSLISILGEEIYKNCINL